MNAAQKILLNLTVNVLELCLLSVAELASCRVGGASYNWHDLVPVLGLYSQNKLIFHCIHDFDKYQVILNLSLYLDIFPLFSLKSITDMVLKHSDKVKKKS